MGMGCGFCTKGTHVHRSSLRRLSTFLQTHVCSTLLQAQSSRSVAAVRQPQEHERWQQTKRGVVGSGV
jgi:hypothetical protein